MSSHSYELASNIASNVLGIDPIPRDPLPRDPVPPQRPYSVAPTLAQSLS